MSLDACPTEAWWPQGQAPQARDWPMMLAIAGLPQKLADHHPVVAKYNTPVRAPSKQQVILPGLRKAC